MKTSILASLLFILAGYSVVVGQDTLTPALYILEDYTVEEMVLDFFGDSDVEVSNVQYIGHPLSVGYFDGGTVELGVNAGIVLSTGEVGALPGTPNQFASNTMGTVGDEDLYDIFPNSSNHNAAAITFDLIPAVDTLTFYYVFGSEEYPEYVNTAFNDKFAFLIQGGPEYQNIRNISRIPGTTVPVTINTLNDDSHAEFYVPYYTYIGAGFMLDEEGFSVLDGSSTLLTCQTPVTPGETYSIKIVIADAGDSSFDSGVFLGLESLGADSLLVPPAEFQLQANQDTVFLYNESKYATHYLWDFGDGTYSSEANPVHVFADPDGPQTIKLITENWCCKDSMIYTIELLGTLLADFETPEQAVCAGEMVQFTDLSAADITAWQWEFPGGTPSTSNAQHPEILYENPGTYDVHLTITNDLGTVTIVREDYLLVVDNTVPLSADFFTFQDLETIEFTSAAGNETTYFWDFGDGTTSTLANPEHEYSAPGQYLVTLTVSNACFTDTETMPVSVQNFISINLFGFDTTGCAPHPLDMWNGSYNPSDIWYWEFPGGVPSSSTEKEPEVTFPDPGSYEIILTAGVAPFIDSDTFTVTVLPVPEANYDYQISNQTITFNNLSQDATDYSWDFGDGNSSDESTPSHTYTQPGTYAVELVASNGECSEDLEQLITLENTVQAGISADQEVGCVPFEVQFEDITTGSDAGGSFWLFPGGIPGNSTEANPLVSYTGPGVYDVQLIAGSGGFKDTLSLNAFIKAEGFPFADFEVSINGIQFDFVNTSMEATSYFWDFGDGNTSTEIEPSHNYTEPGTYTVSLFATNTCGTDTLATEVMVSSTDEISAISKVFRVFPNPVSSFLSLVPLSTEARPYDVSLVNVHGQTVLDWASYEGGAQLDLSDLPRGVYLLQIRQENQLFVQEVVLQ